MCFPAILPPLHLPTANADDLGGLKLRNLLAHRPHYHFMSIHRPLHRGARVVLHVPPQKAPTLQPQSGHFIAIYTGHIICYLQRRDITLT